MTANHFLQRAFCACVLLLAIWRFSENTADPDLWGHVIFGQRMIHASGLERTEPFSWTNRGYEWVNHEVGAEVIMGATHQFLGGTGLWMLAMTTGLFTFWLALKMGNQSLNGAQRMVTWGIAALAAKEMAFGFSVRPQIFTAVALVLMLWILRRAFGKTDDGKNQSPLTSPPAGFKWLFVLPLLFVLWINTHGGALAGFCLLVAAAFATGFQFVIQKVLPRVGSHLETVHPLMAGALNLVTVLSLIGLCLNPWKAGLIKWLIGSVLWFRPEISEWNPPAIGVEHAGMFALIPISVFAFTFSRRKRWLWEIAVVAALALVSARHVRHIPLFAITVLALVPPHLADALARFEFAFANIKSTFSRPAFQKVLAGLLVLASGVILFATLTYKKERFYTIEVPSDEYPLQAIQFLRGHEIKGNMISFFDWGEQCIWELPDSAVSIDGRLDTCYSRELLREHWNFYQGKPFDPKVFDLSKADYALLRTDVVGISSLEKDPAWKLVYRDPLSVIFVRDVARFPKLNEMIFPVTGPQERLREAFPSKMSENAMVGN